MQNVDVFEANDSQYNTNVSMAVSMNRLPDIMAVSYTHLDVYKRQSQDRLNIQKII